MSIKTLSGSIQAAFIDGQKPTNSSNCWQGRLMNVLNVINFYDQTAIPVFRDVDMLMLEWKTVVVVDYRVNWQLYILRHKSDTILIESTWKIVKFSFYSVSYKQRYLYLSKLYIEPLGDDGGCKCACEEEKVYYEIVLGVTLNPCFKVCSVAYLFCLPCTTEGQSILRMQLPPVSLRTRLGRHEQPGRHPSALVAGGQIGLCSVEQVESQRLQGWVNTSFSPHSEVVFWTKLITPIVQYNRNPCHYTRKIQSRTE